MNRLQKDIKSAEKTIKKPDFQGSFRPVSHTAGD
jgi:hypothetical protein